MQTGNDYLGRASSDESDIDQGYDSEAAEISKVSRRPGAAGRANKRRKLSHTSDSEDESQSNTEELTAIRGPDKSVNGRTSQTSAYLQDSGHHDEQDVYQHDEVEDAGRDSPHDSSKPPSQPTRLARASPKTKSANKHRFKNRRKQLTPGVIYLSSLPPYLRPSALRNLISARGFTPITRLFLTPASKASSQDKPKNTSRQLYTEGWIEFPSKHTAKECVAALNAQSVGGKKGGYYRDDLWNMRYLRGLSWEELMEGVRGERREKEAREDEERRRVAGESKRFIEAVSEGKRAEGMREKRRKKLGDGVVDDYEGGKSRKTQEWRQNEVMKSGRDGETESISEQTREVLAKIF